jgi:hypothetical protein
MDQTLQEPSRQTEVFGRFDVVVLSRIRWLDQRIPFAIRSLHRFAEVRHEWQVPDHGQ